MKAIESQSCDCTFDYYQFYMERDDENNKPTEMEYKGNGIYECPKCHAKEDMSRDTYKVRLLFRKTKGCEDCSEDGKDCGNTKCKPSMMVKLLEPFDKRLLGKWDTDSTGIIKEALEDDLKEWGSEEGFFNLGRHKEGLFDVELLYNYYRCSYEYEEYDLNLRIIAEEKVHDSPFVSKVARKE